MDPKKATQIEEVEALRLQNVSLRLAIVTKEREDMGKALLLKYGADGERLNIEPDGTITRTAIPVPLQSVPEGA